MPRARPISPPSSTTRRQATVRQSASDPRPTQLLVIAFVVLGVFWPVVTFDFLNWDDDVTLWNNKSLNPPTLASLKTWWTQPTGRLWNPAVSMVQGVVALVQTPTPDPVTKSRLNPYLFHGLNALIHLASTVLLWLILQRLGFAPWPSCAAALVFGVHPLQVETVAWATALKDVLFAFFCFAAIYTLLLQTDPPAQDSPRAAPARPVAAVGSSGSFYWLIASGFYFLATLSKPTAIILPLMVGSLGLLRPEFSPRRIWKWMLLWVVLSIPCIYMTLHVQPFRGDPLDAWKRPVVALDSLAFYLYKVVWPASLTIDYGRTPNSIFISGVARWTWIVPVVVLIFLLFKNNRVLWCAAILFVAPILLVLGLIPFDFQWLSTVGDRYVYLSFFGIALAVAWALVRKRAWVTPVVMIVIAALAIRSWFQVWRWQDSMSLLTHAISVNPRSFVGLNNLAVLYDHAGNPQRELELLDQALVVKPHAVLARLGRSVALAKLNRWDEAVENYRLAFASTPEPIAFEVTRLAGVYGKEGHIKEGLIYGKLAVELSPQSAQAHLFYGSTLGEAGRRDEAIAQLQKAIELQPDNVVTECNLATMFAGERKFDKAAAHYNAALKLQPRLPAAVEGLRRLDALRHAAPTSDRSPPPA